MCSMVGRETDTAICLSDDAATVQRFPWGNIVCQDNL